MKTKRLMIIVFVEGIHIVDGAHDVQGHHIGPMITYLNSRIILQDVTPERSFIFVIRREYADQRIIGG
jgi:hypothetical protein